MTGFFSRTGKNARIPSKESKKTKPERHTALKKRSQILRSIREYFDRNGFLEVETPLRIPAPAPETHIDLFESGSWYLQSSPELCMKRLIANGFDRVYQICKCFRNHERSERHLPELTLLEWYSRGETYQDLMTQCRELLHHIAWALESRTSIVYNKTTISLEEPWETITVKEAFSRYTKTSVDKALADNRFDDIMSFEIEPMLGTTKPLILMDYPASLGALARLKPEDPSVAERFELYIAGIELANGFTELTDPVEQRQRFNTDLRKRLKAGKKAMPLPEPFLEDLASMPETAGIALGVDRLVMLFTNAVSIDDVVAFTPEEL